MMADKTFNVRDLAVRAKWLSQDWAQWEEYRDPTSSRNLEQSVIELVRFVREDCSVPTAIVKSTL